MVLYLILFLAVFLGPNHAWPNHMRLCTQRPKMLPCMQLAIGMATGVGFPCKAACQQPSKQHFGIQPKATSQHLPALWAFKLPKLDVATTKVKLLHRFTYLVGLLAC